MTGRPESAVRRIRARFERGAMVVGGLLAVSTLLGACVSDEAAPTDSGEVAVCADLRARENELIRTANEVLSTLASAEDDAGRAEALADGYGRLVQTLAAQEPMEVPGAPELTERLADGQEAALAGLVEERDRFAAEVRAVSQSEEHGQAGGLQTALEKVFSELEPPRSTYVAAGLDDEVDADPGCEHVTQRADPAG